MTMAANCPDTEGLRDAERRLWVRTGAVPPALMGVMVELGKAQTQHCTVQKLELHRLYDLYLCCVVFC